MPINARLPDFSPNRFKRNKVGEKSGFPSPSLRLKSPLLPVLAVAALVMQILDPYRVWVFLLVAMGCLWLLCLIWARSLMHGVSILREIRFAWAQVGDKLEERFTLTNTSLFPALWVEVHDQSTLPGRQAGRVTGINNDSENQWYVKTLCTQRGLYTLGPTNICTGDPFGIYTVTLHDPASRQLMVLPPVVPLPEIEVAPGNRSGDARPRPNMPDRTVSSGSVREYLPGDSLRWIHWPTTARRLKPYIRIFDGTPAGDWRILLDLYHPVQSGEAPDSTQEHAIILAASLTDRGLRLKRSVGLIANCEPFSWVASSGGENQRWVILRALALAQDSQKPLNEVLKGIETKVSAETSLIVITCDVNGDWLSGLINLRRKGVVPTVLLLDPTSFSDGPSPSQVVAQLIHAGITHHVVTRDLLNRPEARPGQAGQWGWQVTPRGRAVLVKTPGDMSWKTLS